MSRALRVSARRRVVVIGAGMGGLTAALRAGARGASRSACSRRGRTRRPGGGLRARGLPLRRRPVHPAGPPGLDGPSARWGSTCAESRCGAPRTSTRSRPQARRRSASTPSRDQTADGFERCGPAAAGRYRGFVAPARGDLQAPGAVAPALAARPRRPAADRGLAEVPFLLRPLGSVLARSGLPRPCQTRWPSGPTWPGQRLEEAPSPLAFVPALIHGVGAFYPEHGIGAIPRPGGGRRERGGAFAYGATVRGIEVRDGRVRAVTSETGERIEADAVVSNAGGVGTYLDLLPAIPPGLRRKLLRLPLQSPGVCAYLAVQGGAAPAVPPLPPAGRGRHLPAPGDARRALPRAPSATAGRRPA